MSVGVLVLVGVSVAVLVGVTVAVSVDVDVALGVLLAVAVGSGVLVGATVSVEVAALVGVKGTQNPFWHRAPGQSVSEQHPSAGMQLDPPESSVQHRSLTRLQHSSPQMPSGEQQNWLLSVQAPSQQPSTVQTGCPVAQHSSSP